LSCTATSRQNRPTRSLDSTSWRGAGSLIVTELDDFAGFCAQLTLDAGRPMLLESFQRTMLGDYFVGVPETLILLPKGNAKSTTLAALSLFHMCTTEDADVTIVAASRDQAGILLKQASGFVRRCEGLCARITVKQRELVHRMLGGRVRVLAADVDTLDGILPSLGLIDELHRFRSAEPYHIVRAGIDKRHGQMLTISTAGWDATSVLWRVRQAALERGAERDGCYLRAGDEGLRLHEWSLTPGDDPDDVELVKRANPLAAITIEQLRARHDSPSTMPWDWQRFACGLWTSAARPWVDPAAWDACRDGSLEIPAGGEVVLGVDLGRRWDSTAVVAAYRHDCGRVVVRAWIRRSPGGAGESTDMAMVEAKLRELADRYEVLEVAYDPWSLERSAQILAEEGLEMVACPQTEARMAPATSRLRDAVEAGRLAHDGDPELAAHVLAGVLTESERGPRISKRKSRAAIDGLVALAMAVERLEAREPDDDIPAPLVAWR
jgi:phage terminase large subunit-like protein